MEWEYVRHGVERYHDHAGKIHGAATKGHDEYYASLDGRTLGSYITMESAKKAVELAHNNRMLKP